MKMLLNKAQVEAIEHFGAPLLILAGAGAGKTTVITQKITYTIRELGVEADRILALTFTNKAASEMKARLGEALVGGMSQPFVGTFHVFALTILRQYAPRFGLKANFTIIDTGDQKQMIKQIMKRLNISEEAYPIRATMSRYDYLRNCHAKMSQVLEAINDDNQIAIVNVYEEEKKQRNCVDFNDMLIHVLHLFQNDQELLTYYQDQYPFIFVDEYQDTNAIQYELIALLAKRYQNIVVVGDFDQNIYSWRGANIQNILNFEKDYTNAHTIKLEQNYRSTQTILDAANTVIGHNQNRKEKQLWTENGQGEPITWRHYPDDRSEATDIAKQIQEWIDEGGQYNQCAILMRTNAQSRSLEAALTEIQIPYRLVGALRFFDRQEVKDMLAYLKIIYDPTDDLALLRILNRPTRGIGQTTITRIQHIAQDTPQSIYEVLTGPLTVFTSRAVQAIQNFTSMIQTAQQQIPTHTAVDILKWITSEVRLMTYYEKLDPQKSAERRDNMTECINVVSEYEGEITGLFDQVALLSDAGEHDADQSKVMMMTIHNAKGLEFDRVYLPGFEDGILPHYNSIQDGDIEEERRLCYVAMTRAGKQLCISGAQYRMVFGETRPAIPSRFLEEIPEKCLKRITPHPESLAQKHNDEPTGDIPTYQTGQWVHHASWGRVQIMGVAGEGDQQLLRLGVNGKTKQVMAKYAPLTN